MIRTIATSVFISLVVACATSSARRNTSLCDFSVVLPPGSSSADQSSCPHEIKLPRENTTDRLGGDISIETDFDSLEEVCDRFQLCKDANGHWRITGRAGARTEARTFSSHGLRYVIPFAEVGRYAPGYQGSARAPVALVMDRWGNIALFSGDIDLEDDPRFEQVVRSFRFTK